jgi:hypothetical protein
VTDEFRVRPTDLVRHADHLGAIAERITTAKQAGEAVQAGSSAYSQLCVMVPIMLNGLQQVLVDAIGTAAESIHDTTTRLHAAAEHYDHTDATSAEAIGRVKDRL